MYRITALLTIILFMGLSLTQAQNKNLVGKSLVVDEPTNVQNSVLSPTYAPADGDYILVDTMGNAFGTGSSHLRPIYFEPFSGSLAMVYRGHVAYATGSGELWYSISTDFGVSWSRVAAINGAASQRMARYPTMTINYFDNIVTGAFAWPELNPNAFGWLGYGADQPLGSAQTYSDIIPGDNKFSSEALIFSSDNSDWVYWVARNQSAPRDLTFFRTQDYLNVESFVPPQWADTVFSSNGQYIQGGVCYNGVLYFAAIGAFNENIWPAGSDIRGWPIGYSKSTDNGDTWSNFSVPDWRTISGLERFDQTFDFDSTDGNTVQYDGAIQVDKMGYVHLITALTDTNDWSHAVVDLYETENGWAGDIIFSGLDIKTYGLGPGLGQMGPSPLIATDSSHSVMAVQWINKNPQTPWADVYLSHKRFFGASTPGQWSEPINLTNSPNINNTAAHLAPYLLDEGNGHFVAFSSYVYALGATGPFSDTTAATGIYAARVPFDEIVVSVDDGINQINSFELSQNYPNPFNPTTRISYSLSERSNVTLKVYDVLGNEVATLVNTTKSAGNHVVTFGGENLASGLYIYTLKAGNFISSKKMVLIK